MTITFEIEWTTVAALTIAVMLCMAVYAHFFVDDDDDKKG